MFEGDIRNRIIVGSSNLTKTGLFYNVESSVLLDFTNEDKAGKKVLNQLKDYFEPLLEFSSDNLEKVTKEYIEYLVEKSLISTEKFEKDEDFIPSHHDNTKKKLKNPKIGNLGDIEITEGGRQGKTYKFKITEEYMEKWDGMFERMKAYIEKYGRPTVSKKHPDRTLFGWYQKQKLIFNDPDLEMPQEHFEKLKSIDFYFGDGHQERSDFIRNNWLDLLKQAIADGENVSQIHSYIYKGETLGTWLQGAKKDPETKKLIEEAGFDYTKKSRKADNSARRYIENLRNDSNPLKHNYQNIFNSRIIHRKDKIPNELVEELNQLWKEKFNEERSWTKKSKTKDYTPEWKAYRYNKELNPEGKWYLPKSKIGSLYEWVWGKKKNKQKMDLVIDKFTEQEKQELKMEGFPID
jgi:hypothetical protein